MSEVLPHELKLAVEGMHGRMATLVQSIPVHEEHGGQVVWDGTVHVFDLADHPKASRAYAWSSLVEGSDNRRFYAVLQLGIIAGPAEAVRAAIMAEQRTVK